MAEVNGNLLVKGQHLNLKPESLSADPLVGSLGTDARLWFNNTEKALKLFDGDAIIALGAGGGEGGVSAGDVTTAINTALANYYTEAETATAIADAVAPLATTANVNTAIATAVDNALAGLDFQADVLGFDTDFAGVAGRYIFLTGAGWTNTAAGAAGDIVEVSAGGLMTALVYDVSAKGPGALTWNRDTGSWLRWDGTSWAEFGGLSGFTAGNGLSQSGDTVSVKLDGASLTVGVNGLKVGDLSATYVTPAALGTTVDDAVAAAVPAAVADVVTSSGLVNTTGLNNAIDNALTGLDFQADVIAMETSFNSAFPGRYIYTDGFTLTGGAALGVENGDIVDVNAGGAITAIAYDVSVAGPGALAWNRAGAAWMRWDGIDWAVFGGLTGVTAGDGIEKDGDIVSVKAGNSSIIVDVAGVKVGDLSATYVTVASLGSQIDTAVGDALTTELAPYAKTADVATDLATALTPYAKSADVTSEIATAVTGLATTANVNTAIDAALAGLDFQADVLGREADFAGVAGRYIITDGFSGLTAVASNTNDIITVDATGLEISVDYDVSAQGPGALVWSRAAAMWLRWNGTNWAEFGGLSGVTAGNGIETNGAEVSVKAGNSSIIVDGTGVKVGDLSATYVTPAALTTALDTALTGDISDLVETAITDNLVPYKTAALTTVEITNAIDGALAGLDFQADVRGLDTNYGAGNPGRYIATPGTAGLSNGAGAAVNDIVLIDGAGNITEIVYDVSAQGAGALVWNTATSTWLRWDGSTWAEFGGLQGFTAGNGIEKTGDVVSVKAANATILVDANGVQVGDLSATYATQGDLTAVAGVVNDVQAQVGASFYGFSSGATSATTHTVTHNLNYQWPIVQVIDPVTNKVITPDSIEFTSANELVITLAEAATLRASVSWLNTTA
jgi:hypothetical protein